MDIQTSDGIVIYCLPECAKCKLTGEHVEEMDECPCCDSGICTPDVCYYYYHYFEDLGEDSNNDK